MEEDVVLARHLTSVHQLDQEVLKTMRSARVDQSVTGERVPNFVTIQILRQADQMNPISSKVLGRPSIQLIIIAITSPRELRNLHSHLNLLTPLSANPLSLNKKSRSSAPFLNQIQNSWQKCDKNAI